MGNYCAFDGEKRIGSGDLHETAASAHAYLARHPAARLLIFDNTGRQIDLDLRGEWADALGRLPAPVSAAVAAGETPSPAARTAGRPRLGVVAREVTLLPRHWEWLSSQSGGASVSLRKLVEKAIRENQDEDRARAARDATFRFMQAIAGNMAGFEEANRSLYAVDRDRFIAQTAQWPEDIRLHARLLAEESWDKRAG